MLSPKAATARTAPMMTSTRLLRFLTSVATFDTPPFAGPPRRGCYFESLPLIWKGGVAIGDPPFLMSVWSSDLLVEAVADVAEDVVDLTADDAQDDDDDDSDEDED